MVNWKGVIPHVFVTVKKLAIRGRKNCKITNALYLTDKQGFVLAMPTQVTGNHNDLYNIENTFEELSMMLDGNNIFVDGLFINAEEGQLDASI